jgi:predicted secreted protein
MAIAGKSGKVTIGTDDPATVVGIKNWSLELSLDTLETTALGDDWKNFITGLKEWTASSEGDYEVGTDTNGQKALQDAYLSGDTVDIKLYVDDTHYYSGEAYINSLSVEDPVDDVINISIEFTGSGELSFT